ncbi:MAG: DUF2235 domain-containing protein [Xanthobacteraceae bacterium]
MARKIILLSDGTGNSAAKVWRTNVWRIFESLDLTHSDQIAFYDDGVGTSSFKPLAILGGAFGYGLKRNVIDLYMFACRNYRSQDDEIFGFGFSRGAFTIRVVIGLILEQGLVVAGSERELRTKAEAAYRAFRRENFHTYWPRYFRPEEIARGIGHLIFRDDYSKTGNRQNPRVRFLGLWDTVAAYGMPVEEMARGISQWIWPWQMPDYELDGRVKRACHALSVDDERTTFHPVLWDERHEEPLAPRADGKRYLTDERISQVWFPGVHSNVGGGYPDDSVSQISLIWVMSEAQACGLEFKSAAEASPQTFEHPTTAQDKDGRIYDPRSGLGGYYRYGPRNIFQLCKDFLSRKGTETLPRVHESVLKRIQNDAHLYAPKGLPERYEVVTAEGLVLPPEQNPYESSAQALARSNLQETVWNTIWWRRIVYFMSVFVSIWLVIFPLEKAHPVPDELTNPLRWVSDVVRAAGSFLPEAAAPWINGYARAPGRLILFAGILAALLFWGSRLSAKIQDQMGRHWQNAVNGRLVDLGAPTDLVYRLRTSAAYVAIHTGVKKYVAPAVFALLFVFLGLALTSHVLFNIQDYAGWVCREKLVRYGYPDPDYPHWRKVVDDGGLKNLGPGKKVTLQEFKTSELCQSTGVWLERNQRYVIKFESTESFNDHGIPATLGFYSLEAPGFWNTVWMIAAIPLRRELTRPWFRVVARIGGKGGEESFLDPDETDQYLIDVPITATRDGELFLFVNDAVIGIPGLYGVFYRNNQGSTTVTITHR